MCPFENGLSIPLGFIANSGCSAAFTLFWTLDRTSPICFCIISKLKFLHWCKVVTIMWKQELSLHRNHIFRIQNCIKSWNKQKKRNQNQIVIFYMCVRWVQIVNENIKLYFSFLYFSFYFFLLFFHFFILFRIVCVCVYFMSKEITVFFLGKKFILNDWRMVFTLCMNCDGNKSTIALSKW